jgi:hypothetical protein
MQDLKSIRDRILPMMQIAVDQYQGRVPAGYPIIVDDVERGAVGLEIEPNFALYITKDDTGMYAEVYRRLSRTDSRATAQRQKYGGQPLADRRPLSPDVDDQTLRNLIGELKNYVNFQPGNLYLVDD